MLPIQINVQDTLQYVIKPITEQDNLFNAPVGQRRVAAYLGVSTGDPLSAFQMPNFVIQKRPTTAEIDAESVAPFGNPTASKQTWGLNRKFVYPRFHGDLVTENIGLQNHESIGIDGTARGILNNIASQIAPSLNKDLHLQAFWSATAFDPATTYDGTHDFPAKTIASMQEDNGFMPLLKTALAAAAFTNYKSSNGTGGIDVDGATLSSANAAALANQMIANMPRKLRSLNSSMPSSFKPYAMISNDWYYALEAYLATTFAGSGVGYQILAYATDGKIQTSLGLMYKGFEFYNGEALLDEYWEHTNPATKFNHMGYITARENLSLGLNLRSPQSVQNGEVGMTIYEHEDPKYAGATDLAVFLEMDTLISDTSLFSTVGFELLV
jgi:hypothetical protein